MKQIDNLLNRITMYRLVVYSLMTMALSGIMLSAFNILSLEPIALLKSLGLLLVSAYVTELAFSKIWRVPYNQESWLISALILFLILKPPQRPLELIVIFMAGAVASASKYIVAWKGKHLFNPAAFAASLLSLTAIQATSWWVGNSKMWPLVLILGLAIVRKIHRTSLLISFVLTAVALQSVLIIQAHHPLWGQLHNALIASPLIFLSTIMLTEPATMPPLKVQQIIFGIGVAVAYVEAWKFGPIYIYPEVALLLGNIYAFAVSPPVKARLILKDIQKISDQVYNYIFTPDKHFMFLPGQYMEWTLGNVSFDGRGNRRSFTIASSPTEQDLQIGVKFYNPSSAYKLKLSQMKPGDEMYASQLSGNFTLGNPSDKMCFIAGGIGVTPFRSMAKYITDNKITSDIILIYMLSNEDELAYKDVFRAAAPYGLKLIPVLNDKVSKARGTVSSKMGAELIARLAPDFGQRKFYVSGPNGMVISIKQILQDMGVKNKNIKTDYFAGY